jgi:hypothetical protein
MFWFEDDLALLTTKTHHNNTKDDGKWRRTKK